MTVIAEVNLLPLGEGVGVSKVLAPALRELETRGVRYEVTAMCTIFEATSIDEAFEVTKAMHEAVFRGGVKRIVTSVKIDDRRDRESSMQEKVAVLTKELRDAR